MSTISIFLLLSGGALTMHLPDEESFGDLIATGAIVVGAALGALHLLVTACDWLFVTFLL